MSFFSRLLSLHSRPVPLEDFFTEAVAALFSAAPGLFSGWLVETGIVSPAAGERRLHIRTQPRMEGGGRLETGSRLDIVIELQDPEYFGTDVIYLESKINSGEGAGQLRRYASLLSQREKARSRTLVYITRDHDPKDESQVLEDTAPGSPVRFVQLRWSDLYGYLRRTVNEGESLDAGTSFLLEEFLSFMKEKGMAQRNVFSAEDLTAISRIQPTIDLLEGILKGEVEQALSRLTGSRVLPQHSRLNEFQHGLGRYVLGSNILPGRQWWCAAGFWTNAEDNEERPSAMVFLDLGPVSDPLQRQEIFGAMRQWTHREGWYDLDLGVDRGQWAKVIRERSLRSCLAEEDPVAAVRQFLVESLQELGEMKQEFPHLPWPEQSS